MKVINKGVNNQIIKNANTLIDSQAKVITGGSKSYKKLPVYNKGVYFNSVF